MFSDTEMPKVVQGVTFRNGVEEPTPHFRTSAVPASSS
jgi:hypothetical protein